jgi:hypothetical protein
VAHREHFLRTGRNSDGRLNKLATRYHLRAGIEKLEMMTQEEAQPIPLSDFRRFTLEIRCHENQTLNLREAQRSPEELNRDFMVA